MANGTRCEIAFVVVSFNSARHIRKCVASIRDAMNGKGLSWSIVVVDNASTDGSQQILADLEKSIPGVRVILQERNIGFGCANNVGFRAVSARFYVLINADAWLIADSIAPVVDAMLSRSNIAVCGLPLVYPNGAPQTYSFRFSSWQRWLLRMLGVRALVAGLVRVPVIAALLVRIPYGREFVRSRTRPIVPLEQMASAHYSGELRPADWVCGAAMVIDGDFIRETGGFDPDIFLYGEDEDLCIAAHNSGRMVVVADVPPVAHVYGWDENRFNIRVADLKYVSLRYFITKNIHKTVDRLLMLFLLPFYVYGLSRCLLARSAKKV